MKFEYRATPLDNKTGKSIAGVLEATDFKDVIKQLLLKRLYPIEIIQLSEHGVHKKIDNLKKLQYKLQGPKGAPSEEEDNGLEMAVPKAGITSWKPEPEYLIMLLALLGIILVLLTG